MGNETLVSPNKNGIGESSLEDIEKAYLELIKAYSSCLAYIIIEKRYLLHFMVPLIIMRRMRKRVNTLRATFLFIIAAQKKEGDGPNSIHKFKQYSEDLNTLREHIIKSESSYIFSHSTPAIVSLLLIFTYLSIHYSGSYVLIIDVLRQYYVIYVGSLRKARQEYSTIT
jgi:hypothetical protein